MGTLKLMIVLCCTSISLASHHTHVIPVEGYETELQDLGEHVITPEAPVKVIKITKTVAVKVPVPYPVKVVEKVPYPVHVSKPYPVPVPHIVRIPTPVLTKAHHEQSSDGGHQADGNSYDVHENNEAPNAKEYEPSSESESYGGGNFGNYQNAPFENEYGSESLHSHSYGGPNSFHGSPGGHEGSNAFESRSYDEAIQKYLDGNHPNGQNQGSNNHY
ncbi:uncharacterized protein [Epargyreus clarus]|uniref:uncharacterized protein n=1 Tax=Epargyreus clarus TaxID=520877 RepID=UPI003C2C0BFC